MAGLFVMPGLIAVARLFLACLVGMFSVFAAWRARVGGHGLG
ncbi:hypothetical protein [Arenimonas daejeonensis]|nr:hypothetical protein [Arenimonas daejeonensis]